MIDILAIIVITYSFVLVCAALLGHAGVALGTFIDWIKGRTT